MRADEWRRPGAKGLIDWAQFLSMRARELYPGGRMVVLAMAAGFDGELGQRALVNAIYGALLDLQASGFLSGEDVGRMVIPSMARTKAEHLAPFAADGQFHGLTVEQIDIYLGQDYFWADYIVAAAIVNL